MHQWIRKQGIMGDDPPYLAVGTEVSAKYKGAFCEAKVRKVVRTVKCKVTFKQGLGTANVTDDQIRGTLRVGSICEVKHPEKKEYVEATINKIQDCSQYTVVFDDGDITTLRRTALCLKSGRHFAESETLDQLPLTHPEHFGNPVIGGRKGRRSRQTHEESSDEEDIPKKGKKKEEKEADIGKVVCVELGDKKKQKDNWFPGLVVAPTAQDTVRIRVRDEYLVRSFKDGRYYTVPKKEATEFTREIGSKVDNNTLKAAVEKALLYLDRDELPPHWDRDLLFGMNDASCHSDSEGGMDSDSSDDEPREEKDHFVAQLYKFMDDRGTPINKGPTIGTRDVDLYKLFKVVHKLGGYNRVTNHNQWKTISHKMGFGQGSSSITNLVKQAYKKFLHSFEDFYRKLGCTMVNHPRGNRSRHRAGRSLIRDRDRATPISTQKDKDKEKAASSGSGIMATTEKSNEATGKNVTKEEKKEEEKPSEEKKDKESVSKIKEQILKVKEQGAKLKEQPPLKGKEVTAKVKEQTPKSKEAASKLKEIATKSKEQVAKGKETVQKAKEQGAKGKEQVSKAKEQLTKTKDQSLKIRESTVKPKETVSKAREPVSKVKDQVSKGKDASPKTKEPVLKMKNKLKEEKEQPIKEEPKQDKVKVKNEALDTFENIQENSVKKEEKQVSEVKEDEKVKEKDKEVIEVAAPDECEVVVVAEVKSKGKAKDLKVPMEEPMETICDIGKTDEKTSPEAVNTVEEKKEVGAKISEEDVEESEKKVDKKTDEDEKVMLQYTRSKSKEDLRSKKDTPPPATATAPGPPAAAASAAASPAPAQDRRSPVREIDKGGPPRPLRRDDDIGTVKKRGRKRKDTDDKGKPEETLGQLASHIAVGVGDKLQVYYGPTHESKVTYEAKMSKPVPGKRGRPSLSGRPQEGTSSQQTPRSTTPSSVTSTSSRTNRSATSPRVTRNTGDVTPTDFEFRRRTRRMSGHTDISMPSETESEEEYESEPELESEQILHKIRNERRNSNIEKEEMVVEEFGAEENKNDEKSLKRKAIKEEILPGPVIHGLAERRGQEEEEDDDEEEEDDEVDEEEEGEEEEEEEDEIQVIIDEEEEEEAEDGEAGGEEEVEEKASSGEDNVNSRVEIISTPPSGEKRRSKRCRKILGFSAEKDSEGKHEPRKPELGTESEEEQPKGRDFDLNQIRSELKGIEKAVKLPVDLPHPATPQDGESDVLLILDDQNSIIDEKTEMNEEVVVLEEKIIIDDKAQDKVLDTSAEDVYEFKEPEPFEFEVRAKRESSLSDDRPTKVPRRPIARLLDMEIKTENKPRKKLVRSPLKTEARDSTHYEGDAKKKSKRSSNKKSELVLESDKVVVQVMQDLEPSSSEIVSSEPVTPQKNHSLSACEEAFDKLCESPSFHVGTKPGQSPTTPSILVLHEPESEPEPESKTPELEQLSLLHDDGDDDDNEDRLVISETDDMETEIGEPLFSYPQRDHEELFPTLVSSEPPVSSVEPSCSEQQSDKSMEPPLLSQINSDIFGSFTSALDNTSTAEKNSEVCKTPVKADEIGDGADCGTELASASHSNVDVMNLYSMDDEFEDDPINAAIRRVMSQNIMDEDTNDMDIFGGKSALCGTFKPELKPKAESPISINVLEGNVTKRKSGKKSVLSREFVESDASDSDSSDEEQRLVIDKIDDESQPDEISNSSSSVLSLKLPVSESSDFDMKSFEVKVQLGEPEDQSKIMEDNITEIMIEAPEENGSLQGIEMKKGEFPEEVKEECEADEDGKKLSLHLDSLKPSEVVSEDQTLVLPLIVDMDLDDNPKKPDPDPDPGPEPPVIILEAPLPEVKETKGIVVLEEPVLTRVGEECEEIKIEVKSEEESESNLLGSLLCQETIPGSPTQAPETCADEGVEDEKILLLEMPFASVPGSNCEPSDTVVPATVSVQEHVPSVQSPILPVTLCATSPPSVVQPPSPSVSKRNSNEAAPVMDNTPPTTPDSTLSTISGSPREEHGDMSPALDNESTKSHRDSFEIDMDSCAEGTKVDHYSEDDSLLNVEVSNSSDNRLQGLKLLPKKPCMDLDKEMEASPKKRRRSRKRSECESNKRLRHSSSRSTRNLGGGGSDSDDTSENSATGCMPIASTENTLSSRSPRPSKYNFYVELAPELDGSQRIALLQQKLQELRKTYMNVKAELACIDRRRKKLRRREREEKATKQEVACS
ncbi:microtubule-associated protein futsch isoform X2 [Anabrus simplex]|uniref:microtubule-associated protein futsch isoform X2 n=1 Tax=Anabrus simplex TaxID=316456 RepID=UPI0035A32237